MKDDGVDRDYDWIGTKEDNIPPTIITDEGEVISTSGANFQKKDIIDEMVDPEDERNMPNFSKHLTPDDWNDPKESNHSLLIGAGFAAFMFLCGMLFMRFFIIGVLHL